jgi:hypothetical protein
MSGSPDASVVQQSSVPAQPSMPSDASSPPQPAQSIQGSPATVLIPATSKMSLTVEDGAEPRSHTTSEQISGCGLLVIYGAVIGFFVFRFVRRRRPTSLWICAVSLGWALAACMSLGIVEQMAANILCWAGLVVGVCTLWSGVAAELRELREGA